MLREHSAALLAEVRRFVPDAPTAAPTALLAPCEDGIGAAALNKALKDRESEAVVLGARLKELRAALTAKDKRMESSSADLDATIREVRHRQLDLEFQQLKLEERVRANSELENSQRQLTAHVEEASLTARHAAIDIDACRTFPRAVRVQGGRSRSVFDAANMVAGHTTLRSPIRPGAPRSKRWHVLQRTKCPDVR